MLMPIVLFFIAIITVIVYVNDRVICDLNNRLKVVRNLYHETANYLGDEELKLEQSEHYVKVCEGIIRNTIKDRDLYQKESSDWQTSCNQWMQFNTEISKELEEKKKDYNRLSKSFNKMASQISKLKREKKKLLA